LSTPEKELIRRIRADLADSFDEELELELDDRQVDDVAGQSDDPDDDYKESRRRYFRELFRLQG
jgi:polyphosphate kinase